jgi:serine/threonine protein kinase
MAFPFKLPLRYVFEGPTFDGGQGSVYVCRDKFLDRKVAIKVMLGVSDVSELRKELAATQGVRSRHVAQLYDVVESTPKGKVGVVQEFVPGPPVTGYPKNADPCQDYIRVIYQISCGLADIHECKKIHRDIKPSNIKLDAENIVKILDFGLATDAVVPPVTIDARGTPCYLAPELYGTPPITYTSAVDIFAFGVTARVIAESGAMLSGFRQTPPYINPLPDFANCSLGLPTEVASALNQTLETSPSKRPTAAHLRDLLARRLLYGKHRAIVTYGTTHELSVPGKAINLSTSAGGIVIKYDGLTFSIGSVVGDAFVNNTRAQVGNTLPNSCVITLGSPVLGAGRTFVPFNVSHPGVVL